MSGTTNRVWCNHLVKRPRASLCVEATEPWVGHIGVDGPVTVHQAPEFDIWPISALLVEKYVGRGDPGKAAAVEAFLTNMRTEPRMLFRLAPEDRPNAIRAIDLRVYRGKRADREHQASQQAG
jgi:hypothetical protein